MNDTIARLAQVHSEIDMAARDSGRDQADVTLIAVSKTFGIEDIRPVIEAGQRVFGENRVQEAQSKWPALRAEFSDIDLHLIGPLQSNKALDAVDLFDCIQTVDREKIAVALAEAMTKRGRNLSVYVQVNIGQEPQKAGIDPRDAVAFVQRCRDVHGLNVEGLMCIPPVDENPGPYFALTRKLAREAGLAKISMGMSGDFPTAIAFGATSVRIGSAIFGHRPAAVSE